MSRAAVLAAAAVLAGTGGWRTVPDRTAGFAIEVPATWQVVPRSTPRLKALIVRTARAKRTALATQLAEVAAARRTARTAYRFQAFPWPPPAGSIVPDVTVKTDPLTAKTTEAALPAIAAQVVQALKRSRGATASAPVARRLPAGRALVVSGTMRLSKSLRSRYTLYLLIRGRTLYSLSFRGPATAAERSIVDRFRFTR